MHVYFQQKKEYKGIKMSLKINLQNPRYFRYRNRPIYLIASGLTEIPTDSNFRSQLQANGINQYRTAICPTRLVNPQSNGPYNCSALNIDRNWGGWNSAFWGSLRATALDLKNRDTMLFLVIFSTCIRRQTPDENERWNIHLWNERNGGPIASTRNGVTAFYEMGDRNNFLFNPGDIGSVDNSPGYNVRWGREKKSQYRQEQLLAKVMKELPEYAYPNIGIVLQWEIFSGWQDAKDWACHMVRFLKTLRREKRPIGLGTHEPAQINYVINNSGNFGDPVFGLMEAVNIKHEIEQEGFRVPDNFPIIYEGYHVRREGYYFSSTEDRCGCYAAGIEAENIRDAKETMLTAITKGMNCSLPFPSYWHSFGNYVRALGCDETRYRTRDYRIGNVKAGILETAASLRSYLSRVSTWNDEPGHEITHAFPPCQATPKSLNVRSPKYGETYSIGSQIPIEWTTSGINGTVKILLVKTDRTRHLIANAAPYNASPFRYTIPGSVTPGTYVIGIGRRSSAMGRSRKFLIRG